MTELEKAYLAGFFDGEGSITITAGMDRKKGKTPNYQMVVAVGQKRPEIILTIHQMVGMGKVYDRTSYRESVWYWRITHVQAREFLIVLLPYLKIKKREAELAIEFVGKFNQSTRIFTPGPTPQNIVDEKEWYRVELQKLKGTYGGRKGRPKSAMGEQVSSES